MIFYHGSLGFNMRSAMAQEPSKVANPGSTLGEAVGALIESELNRLLRPIAEDNGCVFVSAGKPDPRTAKATKLLLKDNAGNKFQIDAVIANESMQPLVLIESKYIRYTKHNRDKSSWVCTAHYSLRRSYPTVRKSIAVLAGRWSKGSKALLNSFDVSLFQVDFNLIVSVLSNYGVNFNWEEKERDKAMIAWHSWARLTDIQYSEIAGKLLVGIEPALRENLKSTLSSTIKREIKEIEVTIETNLGESRLYTFSSIEEAIQFLDTFDTEEILNDDSGPVLWATDE
jgi:hypothetical protein